MSIYLCVVRYGFRSLLRICFVYLSLLIQLSLGEENMKEILDLLLWLLFLDLGLPLEFFVVRPLGFGLLPFGFELLLTNVSYEQKKNLLIFLVTKSLLIKSKKSDMRYKIICNFGHLDNWNSGFFLCFF